MLDKEPGVEPIAEKIPTAEEIISLLDDLVEGQDYKETRRLEDQDGLYLLEIELSQEESREGRVEYSYRRGRSAQGELPGLRIDIVFYDSEGLPAGGHSVAKFRDGEWIKTP